MEQPEAEIISPLATAKPAKRLAWYVSLLEADIPLTPYQREQFLKSSIEVLSGFFTLAEVKAAWQGSKCGFVTDAALARWRYADG